MEEAEPAAPARRDVVLHPRTASARRLDRVRSSGTRVRGYVAETDEVFAFVGAQRRLGLQVFVPVIAATAALLIVVSTTDAIGTWQVGGIPVLWLILGPIALFSVLALAAFNERRALALEDRWIDDHA